MLQEESSSSSSSSSYSSPSEVVVNTRSPLEMLDDVLNVSDELYFFK